jgi:hypothetical protein
MATLYKTFFSQHSSYYNQSAVQKVQQTAQFVLMRLKSDLIGAGYGVDKNLALFIDDGGSGSDSLFINDSSSFDNDELLILRGEYCQSEFSGSGTSINLVKNDLDEKSFNNNDCYGDCNTTTDNQEFAGGVWQCIITDSGTNKIAKINSVSGTQLNLDRSISGSYVAPAIYYFIDSSTTELDKYSLKRSDRSSAGRRPVAQGVVDLQVAYKDDSGNWYCNGSASSTCPMPSFEPQDINMIRLSIVTARKKMQGDSTSSNVQIENGPVLGDDAGEKGYHFRKYSITFVPRNL